MWHQESFQPRLMLMWLGIDIIVMSIINPTAHDKIIIFMVTTCN